MKLLIQLADGFCEKGHSHASEIKKWVTAVDKRYRDFSLRMDKYRCSLEKALGISSDSNKAVSVCISLYFKAKCVLFGRVEEGTATYIASSFTPPPHPFPSLSAN